MVLLDMVDENRLPTEVHFKRDEKLESTWLFKKTSAQLIEKFLRDNEVTIEYTRL